MKKVDFYKKGAQDAFRPIKEGLDERYEDLTEEIAELREWTDDVIDCIEWNNKLTNYEDIVNLLKVKKSKKIKKYKISIIYEDKKYLSFVENLRKNLNAQKNSCEQIGYSEFKKQARCSVDYRIYIGNPEKIKEEETKVLYKAYGMEISSKETEIVVTYNPKYVFSDLEKESFIQHYKNIISYSLERSKKAQKALKSREKRKSDPDYCEAKSTERLVNIFENSFDNILDNIEGKPMWIQIPIMIPTFIAHVVGLISLIPFGVGEILFRATLDGLQEFSFDLKFVEDAQKQILEVKLLEFFKNEQTKDIF